MPVAEKVVTLLQENILSHTYKVVLHSQAGDDTGLLHVINNNIVIAIACQASHLCRISFAGRLYSVVLIATSVLMT